ncbi:MAG: glycosyltransferase family 2 protein [Pseudohongiella sp.]|uniref:glycosyltransferase family 2 protein n=1 Tax=Pseudohongiella sp. TaxID=1979412 RepID=UPI0034A09D3B
MTSPLVSVVMPSFNQAEFLEASINSVLSQDYAHLELIVADGGSTDGSVTLLQRIAAKDKRLRWFSGPDKGPADAINQALAQVRGVVIGWLNSDDLYTPGAIQRAVLALQDQPELVMVYGHGRHVDGAGQMLADYPTRRPPQPVETFALSCFICQPTVFFRRSMYVLLGPLDETLKTSFDFDYWLRAFKVFNTRIGFVDALQAYSRLHDACITVQQRRTVALEGVQLLSQHLGKASGHWLLGYRDELLSGKAVLPAGFSVEQELAAVLKEAESCFDQAERKQLAQQLGVNQ